MDNNLKLSSYKKLNKDQIEGLKRLNLNNALDVLYHIPERYVTFADSSTIEESTQGDMVTIFGIVERMEIRKSWKTKIPMAECYLNDGMSNIKLIFFSQPYIGKIYKDGDKVRVSGKIDFKNGNKFIANPNLEKINELPEVNPNLFNSVDSKTNISDNSIEPVYRESKNVSSKLLKEIAKRIILSNLLDEIKDPIPEHILEELHLPSLKNAFIYAHLPKEKKHHEVARKRFLFEEMFLIQCKIEEEKILTQKNTAYTIDEDISSNLHKLLNVTLTNAQKRVVKECCEDLMSGHPMQRLIEGDVGSGKTLIAASVIYNIIKNKRDGKIFGTPLQATYLAPTEILAMQQFESLIQMLAHTGIEIGYLSGKVAYKFPSKNDPDSYTKVSKRQLADWVNDGRISLLVGTHAVTKKSVTFKDLALVVIDEQHRFGIETRKDLADKRSDKRTEIPHLLSMTATPIPRTLALSIFGNLNLSIVDELPKGRKPIKTFLKVEKERSEIYKHLRQEITNGRQVYVICPKINPKLNEEDMTDTNDEIRSVNLEIENLKKIFEKDNFIIESIHGKINSEERDQIMERFQNGGTQILVATSLIEVGVNIPNASIMIIENSERFGMSQLHQLRGRIGRGEHESTCYVFTNSNNEASIERLRKFTSTNNGFELAEIDMKQRGIGSLLSRNQSGLSDIGMLALQNLKLVEIAKSHARQILTEDIKLENFPELKTRLNQLEKAHME